VPIRLRSAGSVTTGVAGRGGASQLAIGRDMIGRYRAAYPGLVLRLVFSPRWIMWHLLTLGAMVTCGLLAAWQWGRAGSATGSVLNIGYGLQWPLFAVFFGVMWFRMLRLEVRRLRGEQPEEAPPPPMPEPERSGPSPFTPRPADVAPITDEADPELAAYNRMLAALAEQDARRNALHDRARENRTR
jgi:DNA-binding transcriptional regulator of glucitol operon